MILAVKRGIRRSHRDQGCQAGGRPAAGLGLFDLTETRIKHPLAVRAAEAIVRIHGGKDAQNLLSLADAYLANGDAGRAKEHARR